ncbi:MAG: CBS domain-containing protein [Paucibacter sp.]|nr:CBS domain-containing protein [Roseateles sp.]
MKRWEQTLIGPDRTLREALERIDQSGCQMALVVDSKRKLLGILTDGDVRRALLKGMSLSDEVVGAMRINPNCALDSDDRAKILTMMRHLGVHHIPVINDSGLLVGLEMV